MRRAALGLALATGACSPSRPSTDAGDDSCSTCFLGDASSAPDFDFLVLQADDSVTPLKDGDSVPMIFPPQGGRVIFVGVRATNVDGHELQLTGALRDLATQQVRVDSRTVNLIPTGDGYGVSGTSNVPISAAIANFANVALCPNQWSETNVFGNEYGLEVTIQDREGRQLTKKIHVTPQCAEPSNVGECLCICMGGYILGQACPDAGLDTGGGDAGADQ